MANKSGWATTKLGDLRVRYRVQQVERGRRKGRRFVSAILIEPDPDTAEYDRSLTARDLARIKPSQLLDRHEKARKTFPAHPLDTDVTGSFRRVSRELPEPLTDKHLDDIAQKIRWSRRVPELGSVTDWICSEYRVSQATAYRWMGAARKKHSDLPRRSRGPTPKSDEREPASG